MVGREEMYREGRALPDVSGAAVGVAGHLDERHGDQHDGNDPDCRPAGRRVSASIQAVLIPPPPLYHLHYATLAVSLGTPVPRRTGQRGVRHRPVHPRDGASLHVRRGP